jgi:hypothetical protein
VGGPENVSVNRLVEIIAESNSRPAKTRHIPVGPLRLAASVLRPFRPDIAGLLQAAVLMDTTNMRFESAEVIGDPQVRPTQLAEIVRRSSGVPITA